MVLLLLLLLLLKMTVIMIIMIMTVKRLRLLPGVTTLFRDFYRRPILGASNHFYLYLFIAWNLSLLE